MMGQLKWFPTHTQKKRKKVWTLWCIGPHQINRSTNRCPTSVKFNPPFYPIPKPFSLLGETSQQHIVFIIIHKKTIWGHSLPWSHHHPINQTNKSKHKTKKREKGNKAFYKHKEMKKNRPWILDSFVVTSCTLHTMEMNILICFASHWICDKSHHIIAIIVLHE
jgi:hypothetical protein